MGLTLEQQRAIALAKARRRRAQAEQPGNTAQPSSRDATMEIMRQRAAADPGRAARTADMDAQAEAAMRDPGMLKSAVLGANQGVTFGFGDEIAAGLASLSPSVTYDSALAQNRALLGNAREYNPVTTGAAEIGGALAMPLGAAKSTGKLGMDMLRGAGVGGAMSGLYGFGAGEGGLASRADDAMQGAIWGAGIGGAVPAAIRGAGMAFERGVAAPMASMRSAPSEARASSAIEEALRRSGMSADEVENALRTAAMSGQSEFRLADALGNPGQRALSGVARLPGDGRKEIADFLTARQEGQGRRIGSFIEDDFGFRPASAGPTGTAVAVPGQKYTTPPNAVLDRGTASAQRLRDDLTRAREESADIAYSASRANAAPVDTRGVVAALDDRLASTKGNEFARDDVDGIFKKWRDRLVQETEGGATYLSDYDRLLKTKAAIQDEIDTLSRSGNRYAAGELGRVKSELDRALEASSDGYRKANDDFRAASKVIEAVDVGQRMPTTGRAVDNLDAFRGLDPTAQRAARVGYGDTLLNRVGGQSETRNKAAMFTPLDIRSEVDAIAINPQRFNDRIGREGTMFQTGQAALGGSKTADNLADMENMSEFDYGPLVNLLSGNFRTAGAQAVPALLNVMQGRNTATRDMIARMLLSDDIKKAIAPAQAAKTKAVSRNAVLEDLIRRGTAAALQQ